MLHVKPCEPYTAGLELSPCCTCAASVQLLYYGGTLLEADHKTVLDCLLNQ